MRDGGLRDEEDAREVRPNDLVPRLVRRLLDRGGVEDRRVVDDDVEAAMAFDGCGDGAAAVIADRHVEALVADVESRLSHRLGDLTASFFAAARRDD